LTAETERAKDAEQDLKEAIDAEQTRAEAAEKLNATNITAEVNRATLAETNLKNLITQETQRATDAETALDTKFTNEVTRIDTLYQTLTNQVSAMDVAVTEVQKTINEIEKTLNNMKELIAESQTLVREVKNLLDAIEAGTADIPYVKTAGDTMTGTLFTPKVTFTGGEGKPGVSVTTVARNNEPTLNVASTAGDKAIIVTNVADPVENDDAATKGFVDAQTDAVLQEAKDYTDTAQDALDALVDTKVSKAGDTMTGTLKLPSIIYSSANNQVESHAVEREGNAALYFQDKNKNAINLAHILPPVYANDAANKQYVDDAVNGITSGSTALPYVKKAGDTMTGSLSMTAPTVSNRSGIISFKSDDTNQANIAYYHPASGVPYLYIDDGKSNPMTIRNVANPTNTLDAVNKQYVDQHAGEGKYLPLTGGTLTGTTEFAAQSTPTNSVPLNFVTEDGKVQMFATDANATYGNHPVLRLASQPKGGAWTTINITNVADPILGTDVGNKRYIDAGDEKRLALAGGTMTGSITLEKTAGQLNFSPEIYFQTGYEKSKPVKIFLSDNADGTGPIFHIQHSDNSTVKLTGIAPPTEVNDAVPKHYVDGRFLRLSGGEMKGAITLGIRDASGTTSNTLAFKAHNAVTDKDFSARIILYGNTAEKPAYLLVDDTTTTPVLTFRGLREPVADTEAATKKYVDDAVKDASVTGNYIPMTGTGVGKQAVGTYNFNTNAKINIGSNEMMLTSQAVKIQGISSYSQLDQISLNVGGDGARTYISKNIIYVYGSTTSDGSTVYENGSITVRQNNALGQGTTQFSLNTPNGAIDIQDSGTEGYIQLQSIPWQIGGLAEPKLDSEAANKAYVDKKDGEWATHRTSTKTSGGPYTSITIHDFAKFSNCGVYFLFDKHSSGPSSSTGTVTNGDLIGVFGCTYMDAIGKFACFWARHASGWTITVNTNNSTTLDVSFKTTGSGVYPDIWGFTSVASELLAPGRTTRSISSDEIEMDFGE